MTSLPVDDGLYVVPRPEPGVMPQLHFVDLSGGRDRVLSDLPAFFFQERFAVSASPDRQRILFSSAAGASAQIQMVDGFR